MCEVLKLSRTGYYKWLKPGESEHERRDLELVDQTLEIHQETRGIYGVPRIHILFSYLKVSQMLRWLYLSILRAFTTRAGDTVNSVIYHLYSSKRLWQANYKLCVTQSGSTSS